MDKSSSDFLPQLNGLRALAAFNVIISHYSNESGLWAQTLGAGAGQIGVMLFFIISAFLMFTLYFDRPQTNFKTGFIFLQNRFARIFPLFVFVVCLSYMFGMYFPDYNVFDINNANFFPHLYLWQANSILWTIRPEIIFYLIFFLSIIANPFWSYCMLVLLSGLTLFVQFKPEALGIFSDLSAYQGVYKYFISGMIIYFIHKHVKFNTLRKQFDFLLSLILIIGFFGIYPKIFLWLFGYNLASYGWYSIIPLLVLSSLVLGSLWLAHLKIFFSTKLFIFLGDI